MQTEKESRGSRGPRFALGSEEEMETSNQATDHWHTMELARVSGSPLSGHDQS